MRVLDMNKVWSYGDIEVMSKDNPEESVYLTPDNEKEYLIDDVIPQAVLDNSKLEIEEYLKAIKTILKYVPEEAPSTMAKYEGMLLMGVNCLDIINKNNKKEGDV